MIVLPNLKTTSINIYVHRFSPWDHMRSEWTFRAGESNHAVHLLVIPLVFGVDTMCALDAFRPRSRSTSASSRSKPARTGQSANLSENWDAPIHGNFRLGKMLTLWWIWKVFFYVQTKHWDAFHAAQRDAHSTLCRNLQKWRALIQKRLQLNESLQCL